MSLQGSLDTFALPDVLVLLASTQKSGELHVAGSRSTTLGRHPDTEGRLWFDAGGLVGHDVGRTIEPSDAVFELLRLTQGTFSFLAGTPSGGGPRVEVEGILGEAQARLSEWREIELVVPSLDAWLQLSPEPPMAHVSMRGEQWRLVVAVGAGGPVGGVLGHLGLEELPGCRAVKELVESGLVELSLGAPSALPPFWGEPEGLPHAVLAAPAGELDIVFHDPLPAEPDADPEPLYPRGAAPFGHDDVDEIDPVDEIDDLDPVRDVHGLHTIHGVPDEPTPLASWPSASVEPAAWLPAEDIDSAAAAPEPAAAGRASAPAVAPAASAAPAPVPDWRAELGDMPDLDAIANMPTKRRRGDLDGDEPAPAGSLLDDTVQTDEDEEPLNRGLLLKFLSSVRN